MSLSNKSACKGVFVRSRRATHASRDGASKVVICGGGEVRFQNVYRLRRCTLSVPRSATKFIVFDPTKATAFHNPAGRGGFTDGPPRRSYNSPLIDNAWSRNISASRRKRGPRDNRRLA